MFRKLLLAMALLATGLVGSCTLLLGGAAYRDSSGNAAIAVEATRELSRAWDVRDLRPYLTTSAVRTINIGKAQASLNGLKPLGVLKRVINARQTEYRYSAEIGAGGKKTATVVIDAEFENGPATVTVKLASDGSSMKVVAIHAHSTGPLRPKQTA